MPLPFDATVKDLVFRFPTDYGQEFARTGSTPLVALNVDLSTITAATDVVLGRGDPLDALIDLNFQSGWADDLLARVLLYNALLYYRYRVPVHSIVVLLRPLANDLRLDEGVHYSVWPERGQTDFRFEVVRLWQRPVEEFLTGGLGTLPLAPLAQLPQGASREEVLADILRRIGERLTQEAGPEEAGRLWTATFILSGLILPREVLGPLFRGVLGMEESSGYQIILDRGAIKEVKKILLRQGQKRFGAPDQGVITAVDSVNDLERLERMTDRVLDVASWQELLETP
jgi:hypothetical protein